MDACDRTHAGREARFLGLWIMLSFINGNQDWHVYFGSPCDMNVDGMDDNIIAIRPGFTIQPRKVYVFRREAIKEPPHLTLPLGTIFILAGSA